MSESKEAKETVIHVLEKRVNERTDSLEIGTAGKTGVGKCYVDVNDEADTIARIGKMLQWKYVMYDLDQKYQTSWRPEGHNEILEAVEKSLEKK